MKIHKEYINTGLAFSITILVFLSSCTMAQTCRTPGGNRVVIFEPTAYYPGTVTLTTCSTAVSEHKYIVQPFIQRENPGLSPSVTLLDYIEIMQYQDLGIFAYATHGNDTMISIEYYEYSQQGFRARDSVYFYYIDTLQINPNFLYTWNTEDYGYFIGITCEGIQNWNSNLANKTMVYAHSCTSIGLDNCWNALVVVSWTDWIPRYIEPIVFWERMAGTRNRGPNQTNLRREVGDAAEGICYRFPYQEEVIETCMHVHRGTGSPLVVLSPIVIRHCPEK